MPQRRPPMGEGNLVAWLFLHAFLGGIPLSLTTAAASALFLEHHGAVMLPWAYLASGAVVPAVGWMCLRIERRVLFDRFLLTVVALVFAGEIASRAGIALLAPRAEPGRSRSGPSSSEPRVLTPRTRGLAGSQADPI